MVAPAPQITPTTNVLALPADTLLVGDYMIERVLGAGGFGITYLARDLVLDRAVTIKEYFPVDFAARGGSNDAIPRSQESSVDYKWGLDRFIEEAKTLAQFDHPNIVKVFRYFQENSTAYMVLQFEEGRSLKAWQKGLNRAPSQKELDEIISPLLDALSLIHKADFLHRDIAPDNIIVRTDGSPVLIDFGSARGEIARHSRTVSALVKPGYSPYEQYAETGSQQGPWTDIYALGATLYHMISGKRPHDSPSRIVKDELASAHDVALNTYRPRFLNAIDHAMALDLEKRPQSIEIWRGELLAPDEARASLFGRQRQRQKAKTQLAPTVVLEDPLPPPAAPATVPPPPDTPGYRGGFLDFMDGLRRITTGAPTPPGKPKSLASALRRSKNGDVAPESPEQKPKANGKAKAKDTPKKPAAKQQKAPAAKGGAKDKAVVARRRPKPVRKAKSRRWRPIAFKLLIGALIAGLAVKYQNDRASVVTAPVKETKTASPARAAKSTQRAPPPRPTASVQPSAKPKTPTIKKPRFVPRQIAAHKGAVRSIAFTGDGKRLISSGSDGAVKIWHTDNSALVSTITLRHGAATATAAFGSRLLTGHVNGVIALWSLETGKLIQEYQRNKVPVWALAFAGSMDRFIAAGHDWKIALWDLRAGSQTVHLFEDHTNAVQSLAFSEKRALIVSGGADKTVRLWDFDDLELIRTYRGHRDFVVAVAISPDGRKLAGANLKGRIRLWSTKSRRLWRLYRRHKGPVTSLIFSPNGGILASAGADGTVRLWDTNKRRPARTYRMGKRVNGVAFAPDGKSIAAAVGDGTIRVWKIRPGTD